MFDTQAECAIPRNTKQKSLILQCIEQQAGRHITVEEIEELLKTQKTPVAKSTIYRYLATLEEHGVVRKYIISENQPACYQFIGNKTVCQEHYHLMCLNCGRIVHFENEGLQDVFRRIGEVDGLHIDGVRTVFYGICKHCVQVNSKETKK